MNQCDICGKAGGHYPNWLVSRGRNYHVGCLARAFDELRLAHVQLTQRAVAHGVWGAFCDDWEGSFDQKHDALRGIQRNVGCEQRNAKRNYGYAIADTCRRNPNKYLAERVGTLCAYTDTMNDTRTWKRIEQMTDAELNESARQLDAALTELGKACESMDRDDRRNHEAQKRRQGGAK
jgi:hypothetical protein